MLISGLKSAIKIRIFKRVAAVKKPPKKSNKNELFWRSGIWKKTTKRDLFAEIAEFRVFGTPSPGGAFLKMLYFWDKNRKKSDRHPGKRWNFSSVLEIFLKNQGSAKILPTNLVCASKISAWGHYNQLVPSCGYRPLFFRDKARYFPTSALPKIGFQCHFGPTTPWVISAGVTRSPSGEIAPRRVTPDFIGDFWALTGDPKIDPYTGHFGDS